MTIRAYDPNVMREREIHISHPPKDQKDWKPGESRLDRTRLCVADILDPKGFMLVMTRRQVLDLILWLEIEEDKMEGDPI